MRKQLRCCVRLQEESLRLWADDLSQVVRRGGEKEARKHSEALLEKGGNGSYMGGSRLRGVQLAEA